MNTHNDTITRQQAVLSNIVGQCSLLKAALANMLTTTENALNNPDDSANQQALNEQYNRLLGAHQLVESMETHAADGCHG